MIRVSQISFCAMPVSPRQRGDSPPAPADLSNECQALWSGFVSDLAATWQGAEAVSEWSSSYWPTSCGRWIGCGSSGASLGSPDLSSRAAESRCGRIPLLRIEGELRGEVRRGFEKLGLTGSRTGWRTRNFRIDAAGRFVSRGV
jgi:hypothetical protein